MGSLLSSVFIDVEEIPETIPGFIQLLFLFFVYGYILFKASGLISNGSELLLLVPSMSGLIGSIVLPALGGVPDAALVLFSGLGPIESVQSQISIGVGALAGSVIMLITIPWGMSIIAGRVDMNAEGQGNYEKPENADKSWRKLSASNKCSLTKTGINVEDGINANAWFIIVTIVTYLLVQIPAFTSGCGVGTGEGCGSDYMKWCIYIAIIQKDRVNETIRSSIQQHYISIVGAFLLDIQDDIDLESKLLPEDNKLKEQLKPIVREYFEKYDLNKTGLIELNELAYLLKELGENVPIEELKALFNYFDTNHNGALCFCEFIDMIYTFIYVDHKDMSIEQFMNEHKHEEVSIEDSDNKEEETEEESEEVEIPEEYKHLSFKQQQYYIKRRSFIMMFIGMVIVILFSDPMVDVLDSMGKRLGINSFYISFLLAPFISNASEILASYNYALKKSVQTVSISISALQGAAVVNNTLTLGIFLLIISIRGLKWVFSAETIAVIVVESWVIYLSFKKTQKFYDAFILFFLFPFSLFIVYALENWVGLN
ncbi:hypothetical protein WA158_002014 [Blastocystis sp. Blastoise]